MGDDDDRAVAGDVGEGLVDLALGGGVDRRGGVVEDDDAGGGQHAPGDCEALALPAGERDPALSDEGLVAFRQLFHVLVELRRLGGPPNRAALRPRVAVVHVVVDRGREEEGILLHHAHVAAKRRQGHVPHVLAVDGDPPVVDVVVPGQEVGDRRLPAPGRSHDAGDPPGTNLEAHVPEHRRPLALFPVAEGHVLEADRPVPDLELARIRPIPDLRLEVEHLEEARAAGRGPRHRVHRPRDLAHRHLEDGHEGEEGSELADRQLLRRHLLAASPQHEAHRDEVREGHRGGALHEEIDAPVRQAKRAAGDGVEPGHLEALGHEGAHHADAAEVLLHHPGEHRELLLQRDPQDTQPQPGERGADGHEGREAESEAPEQPVDRHEQPRPAPHQDREQDGALDPRAHPQLGALDVEDAPGHQVAGVHPVVVAEREGLHLGVEIEAHPVADELAERLPLVVLHHREESAEDRGDEDESRGVGQRGAGRGVVARRREQSLRMVDGLADELRDEELRDRRKHGGAGAERHPPRMGEGHARDAQQHSGIESDRGALRAHRVGHESKRSVGGVGSGGCGHWGSQGSRAFSGRAVRRARGGTARCARTLVCAGIGGPIRTRTPSSIPVRFEAASRTESEPRLPISSAGALRYPSTLEADGIRASGRPPPTGRERR